MSILPYKERAALVVPPDARIRQPAAVLRQIRLTKVAVDGCQQPLELTRATLFSLSLAVLVATTTLAMGVNLPARLVIIKGTNHYRGAKGYEELPK